MNHNNNSYHFPGGHTPTEQEVKTWYAPLAQKMIMEGDCKPTDEAARAEAKLVWIMPSRDRGRRSQLCGKCHILKGRNEEMLYASNIKGKQSYMDRTLEIRKNN